MPAPLRADLGFGEAEAAPLEDGLAGFDPAHWTPRAPAAPRPEPRATRAAAERTGFPSRENRPAASSPPPPLAPQRRRRTGRNAQLNLKLRPETIQSFCAIADAHDWGLGECFERALALLEEAEGRR